MTAAIIAVLYCAIAVGAGLWWLRRERRDALGAAVELLDPALTRVFRGGRL